MSIERIRAALDNAEDAGRQISFWWRDDDAVAATSELERLLRLARSAAIPVAVAAIPARLDPSLPARLGEEPGARILVHGLTHANHAPSPRKSAEFGEDRPLEQLKADAGQALLGARASAGDLLLPVFVPPWNRISPTLPPALADLGYRGLSTFGPRRAMRELPVVNTHLDPVDWRGTRSAVEPEALAAALERALADPDAGPIGILTHHLVFDEPLWQLTARLVNCLREHPAVHWPAPEFLWSAATRHCTVTPRAD